MIINKVDLVSEDQLKKIRSIVKILQPNATVYETTKAQVEIKNVLATGNFDFEKVYESAGWVAILNKDDAAHEHEGEEHEHHHEHEEHEHDEHEHEHNPAHGEAGHHCDEHCHHHHHHHHEGESEDEYGIGSFVYTRRQPFDRQKLDEYANKWPKNIIRCKGVMWFADEPEMAWVFETSGRQISAGYSGSWLAAEPEATQKKVLANDPVMKKNWDEKYGDRMVKLVIIGTHLDQAAISADLDKLLTPEDQLKL